MNRLSFPNIDKAAEKEMDDYLNAHRVKPIKVYSRSNKMFMILLDELHDPPITHYYVMRDDVDELTSTGNKVCLCGKELGVPFKAVAPNTFVTCIDCQKILNQKKRELIRC